MQINRTALVTRVLAGGVLPGSATSHGGERAGLSWGVGNGPPGPPALFKTRAPSKEGRRGAAMIAPSQTQPKE